ncbi:NAD(P)H-binding protein [Hydrogenophaga sp.]|uniref:NAD(P)H-binding protein n=1 Tax=Hydrogenophaga sp. TaxID=1904254 RepID=UPI002719D1E8|nr:NAD(P)H-binding protein [Hydrogenophaga sp.]MDO9434946.1 NmrA family transcriptional regulator [Hydrogenophaga sp.]
MTAATPIQPILVLGSTGKTGRRVAQRLSALGLPCRMGSRSATPAFDWEQPSTWAPALEGVGAVYISYFPDLAVPGAADTVGAFARLAVQRGVRRLVLLSGRGEEGALLAEQAVQASGADWTIVRATWFNQNFSEGSFLGMVLEGELTLPVGDVPEPFVDADDIADVAVAALTQDGHVGEVYELTGPRLMTFAQAAEEIAQAAGRPVRCTPIPLEVFTDAMAAQGEPAEVVALLRYLFNDVLDGRNARLADGVQRALRRAPRDFGEFAREVAGCGVWAKG